MKPQTKHGAGNRSSGGEGKCKHKWVLRSTNTGRYVEVCTLCDFKPPQEPQPKEVDRRVIEGSIEG